MTELQLYKFIHDNEIEIDWRGDQLMIWLDPQDIKEFAEMANSAFDDGGLDVNMQMGGSVCIDLVDVCEVYNIDEENIHPK